MKSTLFSMKNITMLCLFFLFCTNSAQAKSKEPPVKEKEKLSQEADDYVNVFIKGRPRSRTVGEDYELQCRWPYRRTCMVVQVPKDPSKLDMRVDIYDEKDEDKIAESFTIVGFKVKSKNPSDDESGEILFSLYKK